jgi:hypothetical protein
MKEEQQSRSHSFPEMYVRKNLDLPQRARSGFLRKLQTSLPAGHRPSWSLGFQVSRHLHQGCLSEQFPRSYYWPESVAYLRIR